jgi:transketolase
MPSRTDRANAIRALAMDAVQRANSGHPGAPMGMADIAEVLWRDVLKHNPANPSWFDRDRFVLSNGHGSMLLYALLHLTGYELDIEDLRDFRQLNSKTPGHPEYGHAPGVETTTGPLGQGFGNAVGMAIAEKILGARYNRDGNEIVDHHTYVFVGDGCLMEGISHEVASLAGTLGLGKLICIYDDNGISIDGKVEQWFTDDTPARFRAYGWHVVPDVDGHDWQAVSAALDAARSETARPSIICCKTIIGYGAPNRGGTASAHGSPLGEEEVALAREQLGWTHPPFEIPDDIYAEWDCRAKGAEAENRWRQRYAQYRDTEPALARELERRLSGRLPDDLLAALDVFIHDSETNARSVATREASRNCIDVIARLVPELVGGSADLSGSNSTQWEEAKPLTRSDFDANYIFYGVREFGMTAIANGMALHGGVIPYTGTFLTFMDYARNAVRLAAMMGVRHVLVYTHDSIALGEDGPTHQPVEHLTTLRATPNMSVWRPCDQTETAFAWKHAVERTEGPTALILTRQKIAHQKRDDEQLAKIARGGYVLLEPPGDVNVLVMATGSEVELAVAAANELNPRGAGVRVISMPSVDVFLEQEPAYRESVLPRNVWRRLAVEAAHPECWWQLVGGRGRVVGVDRFGVSAPGPVAMKALGITQEHIEEVVKSLLSEAEPVQ